MLDQPALLYSRNNWALIVKVVETMVSEQLESCIKFELDESGKSTVASYVSQDKSREIYCPLRTDSLPTKCCKLSVMHALKEKLESGIKEDTNRYLKVQETICTLTVPSIAHPFL